MHTHAFPDEIAARAMQKLQALGDCKPFGDGTVGNLVESMNAANVDISVVCAIATKPGQAKGIVEWCQGIRSDRIEPLPSVHPDDPDAAKWIRKIAKEGFAGIKLHPLYQEFAVDEQRLSGIYGALAECGLLLVSHCGRDFAFPDDDDRASPERLARVLDRFPKLRLLCTHMGGYRSWDEVERWLLGRDIYLETSFSIDKLGPERAADMIRRHGVERVMFGTDWPWKDQAQELGLLRSLGFGKEQQRAIRWSNAAKLLGY